MKLTVYLCSSGDYRNDDQPSAIQERFDVIKTELLKHSEIESVTTAMQLPGSAIRDGIMVSRDGKFQNYAKPLGETVFRFVRIIASIHASAIHNPVLSIFNCPEKLN